MQMINFRGTNANQASDDNSVNCPERLSQNFISQFYNKQSSSFSLALGHRALIVEPRF